MYNHQLKTFLEVAEAGSFAGAAMKLYISSSAVIQQINNLEEDLKVSLFTRSKKGVCLTEAGEFLLERAKEIMEAVQYDLNPDDEEGTGFGTLDFIRILLSFFKISYMTSRGCGNIMRWD